MKDRNKRKTIGSMKWISTIALGLALAKLGIQAEAKLQKVSAKDLVSKSLAGIVASVLRVASLTRSSTSERRTAFDNAPCVSSVRDSVVPSSRTIRSNDERAKRSRCAFAGVDRRFRFSLSPSLTHQRTSDKPRCVCEISPLRPVVRSGPI